MSATAMSVVACSPAHGVRHHEPTAQQIVQRMERSKDPVLNTQIWAHLKMLFDKAPDHQLTSSQLIKLFARVRPELNELLALALHESPRSKYSYGEFGEALDVVCPALKWSRTGSLGDEDSRLKTLQQNYPKAHPEVLKRFAEAVSKSLVSSSGEVHAPSLKEIIELGVLLAQSKKKMAQPPMSSRTQKMVSKNLWVAAPKLRPEQYTETDRELSAGILAIELAQPAASGRLAAT